MDKYIWLASVVLGLIAICWFLLKRMPGQSLMEQTWPRLFAWVPVTVVLFVGLYVVSPEQAQVVYYKFALVIAAALLGYWIDRIIFPYSRPDGYLKEFWQGKTWPITEIEGQADHEIVEGYKNIFCFAMIRRAIIIVAVVLGATLGM